MSSHVEMLINKAEGAYKEAKSLREMIERRRREDKVNIENAYETAESERNSGDEANERYWKERADLIQNEMDRAIDDLERRAASKEQEGQKYEAEAHSLAEKEGDDQKKSLLMAALQALGSNR